MELRKHSGALSYISQGDSHDLGRSLSFLHTIAVKRGLCGIHSTHRKCKSSTLMASTPKYVHVAHHTPRTLHQVLTICVQWNRSASRTEHTQRAYALEVRS